MTYGVGLMDPALIPPGMIESLLRYRDHRSFSSTARRKPPVGMWWSRRSPAATMRASGPCPAITSFVFNKLPGGAWGSPERVRAWIDRRGDGQ